MKKTILALTIPALFATSASAVTVYSDEGSQVDLYGRVQFDAGEFGYQGDIEESGADKAENFGTNGSARLGANIKYNLNNDVDLIGKLEWQVAAEGGDGNKFAARYAWAGFRFMDTTDLTFGRSVNPTAQVIYFTDVFNKFGAATTYNSALEISDKVDDQMMLAYAANGVDLRAAYAFADADKKDGNTGKKDQWSASAGYTAPFGLGVAAAYEQQNFGDGSTPATAVLDATAPGGVKINPAKTGNGDVQLDAWYLGVNYSIDGFYFAAVYNQKEEKDNTSKLETEGYELHAQYNVDAWTLMAQYAKEEADDNAGFKWDSVDSITLGAQYDLTSKAKLYAEYVISDSETLDDNGLVTKDDLYGVGIQYNF
ncbi:porin [Oceanimonas marisflavi]|uniref:porin n=1 Tax=Oceanimonas marisflavi TaxID=2059724 RepID=UPI000D30BA67|nr:porin [Oceanimonas marisflavi]